MRKVLMIGLDGATFSLLNPLMNDGTMPFLKDFLSQGVKGFDVDIKSFNAASLDIYNYG